MIAVVVAVVGCGSGVVVVVVVVVVGMLEGMYSGLHCFKPVSTAQYFMHKRLRYWTLTKTVTKWVDNLLADVQSQ